MTFNRYGFAHIGRVGSVFMTLSVTLERFFAIVYPLKRLRLKTILIAGSTLVAVGYNIPRFLEFETILVVDTNSTDNVSVSTLSVPLSRLLLAIVVGSKSL